jgi:hypothetical protein
MNGPYTQRFEFSADSGEPNWVEIPVPLRGGLRRIRLFQVGGSLDGFQFRLLSAPPESLAGQASPSDPEAEGLFDEGHYVLCAGQKEPGGDGKLEVVVDPEVGYTGWQAPNLYTSFLFLETTPAGNGVDKAFEFSYEIDAIRSG